MAAVAEVESGQEGHVADDEAERGVRDVKACQPEVSHVPELAAIVLTCKINAVSSLSQLQRCRWQQLLAGQAPRTGRG